MPGSTEQNMGDPTATDNQTVGTPSGSNEAGRRAAGADQTLESIVFTQGRDAPERNAVDSEYAGRLVSITS
jgi:hypothetical protein